MSLAKVYGRTETEASQDCADSTSVFCCGVRAGGHLIYLTADVIIPMAHRHA